MIERKRKKTSKSFLFALSFQSLRMISRYLFMRKEGLLSNGIKEEITEESYIISQNNSADNLPLSAQSIARVVRKSSLNSGFDIIFLPRDFRKSWRTRVNALQFTAIDSGTGKSVIINVSEIVKNNLLGHINTEQNYDRNKIESFFLPEYIRIWKVLFDLENIEGIKDVFRAEVETEYKKETKALREELQELKEAIAQGYGLKASPKKRSAIHEVMGWDSEKKKGEDLEEEEKND